MATSAAVLEQPALTEAPVIPNKFIYPEFAGFSGEQRMYTICRALLSSALYRTWEIFELKHAYDNDCFLSVSKAAQAARRTLRTLERDLATFSSRGLMEWRTEIKYFLEPDGTMRKKRVMVKDFSGLYALAHEYYLWMTEDPDYQAPDWEGIELVRHDPRLVAKLSRFEDYHRALERQREPAFLRVQADPRFAGYQGDAEGNDQQDAKDAKEQTSSPNATKSLSKEPSKVAAKLSKERINEKAYDNSLSGVSYDSDTRLEEREVAARGYTKPIEQQNLQDEKTNPVPLSHKNVPPGAGKTRESAENHPDVQQARAAIAAAGIAPGRREAEELPPPTQRPLARSFVHEVAGVFGDLNEKGSKTGIERRIEAFTLSPAEVLLCLVRAYVVARDTKDEKIRQRRPDGKSNRMPLFCTMFERFAQALGPGSTWQYSWEQMLEHIAADDRLSLWLSEHQAELVTESGSQEKPPAPEESQAKPVEAPAEELATEEAHSEIPTGWRDGADAYEQGERLMQALVDANYTGVEVALREIGASFYVVYKVVGGGELVLTSEAEVAYLIEQAEQGEL